MKVIYVNILFSSHSNSLKRKLLGCETFAEFKVVQKSIIKEKPGYSLAKLTLLSYVDSSFVTYTLGSFLNSIYEPECLISLVSEYET